MSPYYEHAGITIYHGDCREVLPEMGKVDLVLTDPPYGVQLNTKTKTSQRGRCANKGFRGDYFAKDFEPVIGDDVPFEPEALLKFQRLILWGGNHYASRLPDAARWLVWDKRCGSSSDDNADCEFAWTNLKGQARIFSHYWRGWLRAGRENLSVEGPKLHPTQKPVALMKWCIKLVPDCLHVVDPYAGSGTTLIACKELGIPAIGIEIEERYCEIAAKRLSQEVMDFTSIPAASASMPSAIEPGQA